MGVLTGWFHDIEFIAEDLGFPTPEVTQLLADSRLPGMKVLEFAFDSRDTSSYLPHSYGENCVCYTGTHDNAPLPFGARRRIGRMSPLPHRIWV